MLNNIKAQWTSTENIDVVKVIHLVAISMIAETVPVELNLTSKIQYTASLRLRTKISLVVKASATLMILFMNYTTVTTKHDSVEVADTFLSSNY